MADKVDSITLEIEATTQKADNGIDETIKSLEAMKRALNSINAKKFKQEMESFEDFQKKLQTAFTNIKVSGTPEELRKQIAQVEARLDALAKKENKLKTVSGINENSKQYRNLIYDISEAKNNLEQLRAAMDKVNAQKPLNFWEKPNWEENLKNYGTTDESIIKSQYISTENVEKAESVAIRAADDIKKAFAEITRSEVGATQSVQNVGEKIQGLEGKTEQLKTTFSDVREKISLGPEADKFNADMQDIIDGMQQAQYTIRQMESGAKTFNPTTYAKAVNELRQAREQFDRFKESVTHIPKSMDDVAGSISAIGNAARQCGLETFSSVLSNVAAILPAIETGGMAANAGFQSMAVGLEAVQSAIPVIGIILTIITALVNAVRGATNAFKNGFSKIVSVVKSAASKIRQGISSIIAKFKEFNKKIKETLGMSDKSFSTFSKKMKSLLRLGTFMLLRKAFTYLFKYIGDGFNNLVLYSDAFGTKFHSSVSRLWSDIKWLGNSLSTAFEPIINYIIPALDRLISKLVTATRTLAQFFSALTGKGVYTKAIKLNDNYASSLNKASKAADTLTAGIDELNILQENSGGDGGLTAPEDSFITEDISASMKDFAQKVKDAWKLGDFTDIGKELGDKLAESLANIPWDVIRENARKLGKSLATLINGFIQGEFDGKSVSWWIGHTLAEAVNTAFEFLYGFVHNFNFADFGRAIGDLVIGALDTLDWDLIRNTVYDLANGIKDLFNSIFGNTEMWEKLGTAISNGINTVLKGIWILVDGFDSAAFGTAIGKLLGNALAGINLELLGTSISKSINGLFTALLNFTNTFPGKEFVINLANSLNNAFNLDWPTIQSAVISFCTKLGEDFRTFLLEVKWGRVLKSVVLGIQTAVEGIGAFFDSNSWESVADHIVDGINEAINAFKPEKWSKAINSIVSAIKIVVDKAVHNANWPELMQKVGELISQVNWDEILAIGFEIFAAKWTFKNMFKLVSWTAIWNELKTSVIEGISKIFEVGNDDGEINTIGENIVSGLFSGMARMLMPTPLRVALDGFRLLITGVKALFGIHSPSTVFMEIGQMIVAGLFQGLQGSWQTISAFFVQAWDNIKTHFSNSWEHIKSNTQEAWEHIKNTFTSSWDSIQNSIKNAWENIKSVFANSLENIRNGVGEAWSTIKTMFSNSLETVKSSVTNGWNHIKGTFQNSLGKIKSHVSDGLSNVKEIFRSTLEAIKNKAQSGMEAVKEHFAAKLSNIKDLVSESWNNIKSKFDNGMEKAHSAVQSGWTKIKGSFHDGIEKIKAAITGSDWMSFGSNIVNGIWKGISNGWEWLKNGVKNLATSLYDAARGALGIHSPPKKFSEIGRYIVEGLNVGIDDNKRSSISTISSWADSLTSVPMSLSTKFKVDDSQFQNYQNNYGNDFTNEAIVQRVTREVSTTGAVQAAIVADNPLSVAFREVAEEVIIPAIQNVEIQAKRQADKNEQTIVEIGGRTIMDVVREQKSRNGFSFQPT